MKSTETTATTTAVPTIAELIDAYAASDAALAAVSVALRNDDVLFIASARMTHAAILGGITAKAIADAAKARKVGYASPSAVGRHARTGEILSLDGELEEGYSPREIQAMYDMTRKVNGQRVTVSVTPEQHRLVVAKATDVQTAYNLLVKATRDNLAARRATAKATTADTDSDTDSETSETVEFVSAVFTDSDAAALGSLRASLSFVAGLINQGAMLTSEGWQAVRDLKEAVDVLALSDPFAAVAVVTAA